MASTMRAQRKRRNFAKEENRYDAKRDRLVACARTLAENGNAARVSVTDVTTEMDITRGLFYYYFSGKEELNEVIADTYVKDLMDEVSKVIACDHAYREDTIEGIVRAINAWFHDEDGVERPMVHVLREIDLGNYVMLSVANQLAHVMCDSGLLTDYGKLGEELLVNRACFVVMGMLGQAQIASDVAIEAQADAACAALRYRKRRGLSN